MGNQGLEIEEKVKKVLEKEIGKLTKQKIPIGKNRKGKEFDLVSDDRHVVIEVKSFKFDNETTKKSGYASTRKPRLIAACAYLDKVDAKRKILVLTDKELYEQFKRDMDGDDLFPKVEIRYVPVNSENDNYDYRPVMSKTEKTVEGGKMKTNSQGEIGKGKCRKDGLAWIEKQLGQVDKRNIRVSKCYSPEEVATKRSAWWIEIPLKKLTKHKEMHLLLQYEDKHDEFHHLRIRCEDLDRYVKEGELDLRRAGKEEVISLHLSADTNDIFQDFRGKGKINFKKYLQ